MRVTIVRQSGNPVSEDQAKAYQEDFKERFDKLYDNAGGDMESLNEKLAELDAEMGGKYETSTELEMPKSGKAWLELLERHKNAGILVSTHKDTGKLMMVILDLGL